MLKKLLSIILMIVGAAVLVFGVLSGTVLKPETTVTLSTPANAGANYITVAPEVLRLVNDSVKINAKSSDGGEVALIVARSADITGWLGETPSVGITGASDWETLTVAKNKVAPASNDAAEEAADSKETKAEEPAQSITDSDMWTSVVTGKGNVNLDLDGMKQGMQLLVAPVDAAAKSAPVVSLTWDREVLTPLMMPAILSGLVLILAGAVLFFLARRSAPAQWKTVGDAPSDSVFANTSSTNHAQSIASAAPATRRASTATSSQSPSRRSTRSSSTSASTAVASSSSATEASDHGKFAAPDSLSTTTSVIEATPRVPEQVSGLNGPNEGTLTLNTAMTLDEASLDTAALQQLGLTRRQLREIRESRAQNVAQTSFEAPSAKTPASPDATPTPSSKTTASNWRAAWGVRGNQTETHLRPGQYNHSSTETTDSSRSAQSNGSAYSTQSTHNTRSSHSSASALSAHSAPSAPGTEALKPETSSGRSLKDRFSRKAATPTGGEAVAGTTSVTPVVHPEPKTAHDVRTPASWWGTDAGTPQPKRSTAAEASAQVPPPLPPATETPAESQKQTPARDNATTPPVAGTRRALYSSYRAEAERLSAESDWPVPSASVNEDTNEREEGKR